MKDRRQYREKRGAFVLLAKAPERRFFYWAMPESGIQVTGYQS